MTTFVAGNLARGARRDLQPVQPGHGDVDERDLRLHLADQRQGFLPVARFGNDLDTRQILEQGPNPGPDKRVIIGKQDPHPQLPQSNIVASVR